MPDSADAPDDSEEGNGATDEETQDEREELPQNVAAEAERLTRLARGAVDEGEAAAYREERDELLAEDGFTARIREEDAGDDATLVCYPSEWIEDGVVQIDRVDDVDRGVERPLEGTGEGDWEDVVEENEEIVAAVGEEYDDPHVSNARALADFASNHYAKPISDLTPAERKEFAEEYFPRNAWPSDEQVEHVDDTLEIVFQEIEDASGDPP